MADDETTLAKKTLMHPHTRTTPGVPYWFTRAQASAALERLPEGHLADWIYRHREKWLPADDSPPVTIPLTDAEYRTIKAIVGELPQVGQPRPRVEGDV